MDTFEQMMKDIKKHVACRIESGQGEIQSQVYLTEVSDLYSLCQECTRASFLCTQKEFHVHFRAEGMDFCPTCPLTPESGLKRITPFCMKGEEKAQRYEHALWGTKIV